MKYTHEIVGTHGGALLSERAQIPRVYRPLKQGEYVLQSMELENNPGHMWFIPAS